MAKGLHVHASFIREESTDNNVCQRNDGNSDCANTGGTYGRRGRTGGSAESAQRNSNTELVRSGMCVSDNCWYLARNGVTTGCGGQQEGGNHIRLGVLVKVKAIHGRHRRASAGARRGRGPSLPCVRVPPWRCVRLGLGRDRSFQRVYLHLFR